jgi:hypothetical protein
VFSRDIFEKILKSNYLKIRLVGPEFLHAGGQTYMKKLTVAFRIINMNVKSAVSRKGQWTNINIVTTVDCSKTIYTNA